MFSYSEIIDLVVKYKALGIGAAVACVSLIIFQLGVISVEKSELCNEELKELRALSVALQESRSELAACEAKGSGRAVLLCQDDCDHRIAQALAEAQAWACED